MHKTSMAAMASLVMAGSGLAAEPGDGPIEEVVVNARTRAERLQDVPVSVSTFSEASIERLGLDNVEDTYGVAPGVYFTGNLLSPNREFRQLVVRGVGANSQLEPSVATFIDGVYSPALAFDLEFLDLQQVELLKGPQGALFGRNTEGGALNIISRKPDDQLRRKVKFDYGSFNTAQAAVAVSGPLIAGRLFGGLSAATTHSDGFIDNEATAAATLPENPFFPGRNFEREFNANNTNFSEPGDYERRLAARASLRYLAGDDLEIDIAANVSRFRGKDQGPGPLSGCRCYEVNSDLAFEQEADNGGASVTLVWDLGAATLTSISGWLEFKASTPFDLDGTDILRNNYHDFDTHQKVYSEELRLASNGEQGIRWLAGLYGFKESNYSSRYYNHQMLDLPGGPQALLDGLWNQQIVDVSRTGAAAFGQVSFDLTKQLELSVGARYSWEEAEVSALARFEIPANGVWPTLNSSVDFGWTDFFTPVLDDETWTAFSPSASLRYRLTDDFSAYLTYSEGFKAGGYQKAPVVPADVVPVEPEDVRNYEVGLKGELFDGRLFFDFAAYVLKLNNMQLQAAIIRDNLPVSAITNASTAQVRGLEVTITARPADALTFWASAGYTDSEFENYEIVPGDINADGVVDAGDLVQRSGDPFPNTPELTWYLAAEYRQLLRTDLDLVFYGGYRFIDDTYIGSDATDSDPIIDVPSWDRLDMSAALEGAAWSLKLYVQNVADEFIVTSRWNTFQVAPQGFGFSIHDRVAAPRQIGISYTQRF